MGEGRGDLGTWGSVEGQLAGAELREVTPTCAREGEAPGMFTLQLWEEGTSGAVVPAAPLLPAISACTSGLHWLE